ncbi:thiosulfate oxidation carrier complex protein SoxZ [Candidatus Igneacidithiobacillus taiwanensis]|uniref:thiosulfate oxidation carrier complex protein SoxZ n=1 Tax=Candidatus Igneacidithiobacillus taiwanensis TaxID=1945924 RepID=UPI00289BAEEA|nr:thiosulfate oxidation carrier complex protein SoxZ [Candidatus Igneacidithiobacillus taiwanensis]MCE5359640.1 thiosulfate oxidation carrier complex protein SoxZ [Acidithiobacillus sp.]
MSLLATTSSFIGRREQGILLEVPQRVRAGEIVEVRTLLFHTMETAQEAGKASFITQVTVELDGKPLCSFDCSAMMSPNPYLAFPVRVEKNGMLRLRWVDNNGQTGSAERPVTVQ